MKEFKPHEFQEKNLQWLHERREKGQLRSLILDEMGLGKSVTAILCAKAFHLRKVLVVTKGMVRPAWLERFKEWWPERVGEVSAIREGRSRKGRSKPAEERIKAAYAANIQITSNDLLHEVSQTEWDMLVFDEIHEHVSARSSVSQTMQKMLQANPNALVLNLTGTFVPAEPMGAYNMLSMLWPEEWGKPGKRGDPPYRFKQKFCIAEESEYSDSGFSFHGLNPATAAEFSERIMKHARRTLRSDVAHLLPPIDVSPLVIETGNKKTDIQLAIDWADTAIKESSHVQIFTYRRETAESLCLALQALPRYREIDVRYTHGADTAEQRHKLLQQLRQSKRALLVGTMDSLGTGISLTSFQQYLIIEVTTEANQLAQAIGRFGRLDGDSTTPSRGFVLLREDKDADKISTLSRRLEDTNTLIKNGQAESQMSTLLKGSKTEGALDRFLDDLVLNYRGDVENDEDDNQD